MSILSIIVWLIVFVLRIICSEMFSPILAGELSRLLISPVLIAIISTISLIVIIPSSKIVPFIPPIIVVSSP